MQMFGWLSVDVWHFPRRPWFDSCAPDRSLERDDEVRCDRASPRAALGGAVALLVAIVRVDLGPDERALDGLGHAPHRLEPVLRAPVEREAALRERPAERRGALELEANVP